MKIPIQFRYCPHCGKNEIYVVELKKFQCKACGFVYFHNTASAVAGILWKDEKILLVKRARKPSQGLLDFPGGFVDFEETLEQALIREIKEELNLDIETLEYFASAPNTYCYEGVIYYTSDAFFTCKIKDWNTLRSNSEITKIVWLKPESIPMKKLAFESSRAIINQLRNKKRG